jgi:hypothetical protein
VRRALVRTALDLSDCATIWIKDSHGFNLRVVFVLAAFGQREEAVP